MWNKLLILSVVCITAMLVQAATSGETENFIMNFVVKVEIILLLYC